MEFNLIFIIIVYALILIFVILIAKVLVHNYKVSKNNSITILEFLNKIRLEKKRLKLNNQKVLMVDSFNEHLFNRYFRIINMLISI